MQKLYKIPLLFFLIASCMGLLLRGQLILPTNGITYSYLLHGHSHVMFLGWVCNALFIAYVTQYIDDRDNVFKIIFWLLQVFVLGMLISFPVQGYALYSITFSTLHTLFAFVFIILFFRRTRNRAGLDLWLVKFSLVFFMISSIGPFFLGYLKANDMDHTNLYRNAIYFYLHFQYNGFFFTGILALFVNLVHTIVSPTQLALLTKSASLFVFAAFPTYALSTLWANPGISVYFIGAFGAILQIIALTVLMKLLWSLQTSLKTHLVTEFRFLLFFILLGVTCKVILQLVSAVPAIANLINEHRPIIIAYLHLVLVGVISLFLIGWMMQKKIIPARFTFWSSRLLLAGFATSELLLFISPWQTFLAPADFQLFVLVCSAIMTIAVALFFRFSFLK